MTAGITGTPNQLFLTWGQMWGVLQNGELDLGDTSEVDDNEAMEYANQGIRECSAEILTIYEDYFLKKASPNLSLVQNADTISLPGDIYANKIRGITYSNGTLVYPVHQIKEWHKFMQYRLLRIAPNQAMRYRYFMVNASAGTSASIVLSPPAQENGAFLETWYIRRANEFASESDVCDIPEFVQYVYDHIRVKVYEKGSHPMLQKAIEDKKETKRLMIETLTAMVPDNDNRIEADMSHYMEHT